MYEATFALILLLASAAGLGSLMIFQEGYGIFHILITIACGAMSLAGAVVAIVNRPKAKK